MGAAAGPLVNDSNRKKAFAIGKLIAQNGCVLVNGATTGLPYEAAKGAKSNGGMVVGISPARNQEEHTIGFSKPIDNMDAIIFTGYGYTARNVLNIRSSDMVIILPGGQGTMTEFTIAYEEGKPIGILTGAGGVAEAIPAVIESYYKKSAAEVIFEDDPESLLKKLLGT